MYSEDQEMQDSTATEGIENLVLSFLQQLVDASAPADTTEKMTAQQRRAKSKIQLQLSNRTNGSSRTLTYPRKSISGSARPFGEWIYALALIPLTHLCANSTIVPCLGPRARSYH